MEYLLEIIKIIDGGLGANQSKIQSYSEMLADKLEKIGDSKAANRIRQVLKDAKTTHLMPSNITKFNKVPVDGESRIALADEELFTIDKTKVFLEPAILQEIERFLKHIKKADKLIAEGVGVTPSMLLFGPPGCGKTVVGHLIAARLGLPLLTARTDGLISSYLGNTAKNLRTLFEHAMQRPCILFLDEFDAIAKLRDDKHELGELKRVVISLLQNIDAMKNETILIAATNHEHLLDPAIWRRFAVKIFVNKPSVNIRQKLFECFLGNVATNDDCYLLALVSEGLTGADIKQLSENWKREIILDNNQFIPSNILFNNVLKLALNTKTNNAEQMSEMISKVRAIDPKAFTYRELARLFNVSLGQVYKIAKRKRVGNGREQKITNKNC